MPRYLKKIDHFQFDLIEPSIISDMWGKGCHTWRLWFTDDVFWSFPTLSGLLIWLFVVSAGKKLIVIINCFHHEVSRFTIAFANTFTFLTVGEHYWQFGPFSIVSFSLYGWKRIKMKKRGRIVCLGANKSSKISLFWFRKTFELRY